MGMRSSASQLVSLSVFSIELIEIFLSLHLE
jgi:hypothetical protein